MPGVYSLISAIWVSAAPKGWEFSATLVIHRVWFQHSSLEILGMFLGRSYLFTIIKKTATKSPTLIMFRVTVPAAKVINRVSNIWAGHKKGGKNRRLWSFGPLVNGVRVCGSGLHTPPLPFCEHPPGAMSHSNCHFFFPCDSVSHYICTS